MLHAKQPGEQVRGNHRTCQVMQCQDADQITVLTNE